MMDTDVENTTGAFEPAGDCVHPGSRTLAQVRYNQGEYGNGQYALPGEGSEPRVERGTNPGNRRGTWGVSGSGPVPPTSGVPATHRQGLLWGGWGSFSVSKFRGWHVRQRDLLRLLELCGLFQHNRSG